MSTFTTGDTAPPLTGTLGANLTGATAVVHIRKPDATTLTKTATIGAVSAGSTPWSCAWATGDLNVPGVWEVELQVTYSGGEIQTFGPSRFYVAPQIA